MKKPMLLNATGAYGRTYETQEAAQADWDAEKDFKIITGPYFSKRDLNMIKDYGYTSIVIFDRTITKLLTIEVTPRLTIALVEPTSGHTDNQHNHGPDGVVPDDL